MELPHIGNNCALRQCNRLDFLPVKCDSCSQVFCIEHYKYDSHNCESAKTKDHQVPVCPLCSQPVPMKRDQLPDVVVSQHIDQYCRKNDLIPNSKDEESRRRQGTSLQACSFKLCKQKDLIYLECTDCREKYCIKHRHPTDHLCSGPPAAASVGVNLANNWHNFKDSCSSSATNGLGIIKNKAHQISKSGQAALNRLTHTTRPGGASSSFGPVANGSGSNQVIRNLQGNLSEQEALAIAMNESQRSATTAAMVDPTGDAALARALQESELEANRRRQGQANHKDTCVLS